MAYEKQEWIDYPDETTPISAERLNHMEQGIEDAGESAENLRVEVTDYPDFVDSNGILAYFRMNLYQVLESGRETLSYIQYVPVKDTIDRLLNFMQQFIYTSLSQYSDNRGVFLTVQSELYQTKIYYKDSENVEHEYSLQSGNMPLKYYLVNYSYGYDKDIDIESCPSNLTGLISGYFTTSDDEICYIKYQGRKLETYLYKVYGSSTRYIAYAIYRSGNTPYAVIAPIDTSTHEIITNDIIGKRYVSGSYSQYVYDPIMASYRVDTSGNKKFRLSSISGTSTSTSYLNYKDNGVYVQYTINNDGTPPLLYDANSLLGDFSKYKPVKISAKFLDGTEITNKNIIVNDDIFSKGESSNSAAYYIAEIDTGLYIGIMLYDTNPSYASVYFTILNTADHTLSATSRMYSSSLGFLTYAQIEFEEKPIIDDTVATTTSTYSSSKIETLIADLQTQIDALQ